MLVQPAIAMAVNAMAVAASDRRAWRGVSRVEAVMELSMYPLASTLHGSAMGCGPMWASCPDDSVIAVTRQCYVRMIAFRWHSPSGSRGA